MGGRVIKVGPTNLIVILQNRRIKQECIMQTNHLFSFIRFIYYLKIKSIIISQIEYIYIYKPCLSTNIKFPHIPLYFTTLFKIKKILNYLLFIIFYLLFMTIHIK